MVAAEAAQRVVEALKRAERLFGEPTAVPAIPNAHVDPKPPPAAEQGPPAGPHGPAAPYACLLGSKNDDVAAVCGPVPPQRIWYIENGNLVARGGPDGRTEDAVVKPGDTYLEDNVWLTGPPTAEDIAQHPRSDFWYPLPDGSIGISRWLDGEHLYDSQFPIGPYWGN
ncbi:hypothetical protein [Mycolicibacterium mageritense]|uniref:hypothetical protein n=1 Tax=Mycolicibacterium mageritense TaxID=53462 RepID=UPI0011D4F691|nr:hypothetical protein [Mycolicibacterium mageritense]TXI56290.1 MAG: hypothetical protein E6Q55_29170 [Mycolicibacterium mageritense]